MRNILYIFRDDMKRLFSKVVTIIIVLGLVFLPSIFSWYNILGSWDVFNNTNALTIAVANCDEGYESDLIPIKVNLGERVVSALRENTEINWVFTTEEDAIDGTMSGDYYAAAVIPENFSETMMDFYADDEQHASIIYYSNEKKNAIAPKVTDQASSRVVTQVNEVFVETVSVVALGVSQSIADYGDQGDAGGYIEKLGNHMKTVSRDLNATAQTLVSYSEVLDSCQSLLGDFGTLIDKSMTSVGQLQKEASEGSESISATTDAISLSSDALIAALSSIRSSYVDASNAIDNAFSESAVTSGDTSKLLRDQAAVIDGKVASIEQLETSLEQLKQKVPERYQQTIADLIEKLESSAQMQRSLSSMLNELAGKVDSTNDGVQALREQAKEKITQIQTQIDSLIDTYTTELKPQLDELSSNISSSAERLTDLSNQLMETGQNLKGSADEVSASLTTTSANLRAAATKLSESATKLNTLGEEIIQAVNSGDVQSLKKILSGDANDLASLISAPVEVQRTAVFSAENFGTQMAPLYTTLGLWIGSLLMVVAVKVELSERQLKRLNKPHDWQCFFGRFGVFSFISFLQSTLMAVGNLLFVGIDAVHPFLYLLIFWVAGQVFTLIMYTLVLSFANLGKAFGVLLLILQVTAAGGSYPLQLLPELFTTLSPFIPGTHVINAMRAAMMGVYANDFWIEIGQLLLFAVPMLILGLLLRIPLKRFLHWYVRKVESSKLIA